MHRFLPALAASSCAACLAVAPSGVRAQPAFEQRYVGDLGVAVYAKTEVVRETGTSTLVLPYLYGDYGRFIARVDTFGVRTVPLGSGHLEILGRFSTEGFKADRPALRGVGDRSNPVPLGIGTMQRTSIGAFFLYAMHDLTSGGAYLEGTWGTRFEAGPVTVYPLLGLEYRSSGYVRHLYGLDAGQAAASGLPRYTPGASTVPMAGLAVSVPISGPWMLQAQWRHRRLGDAIGDSPLVARRTMDSGHLAVTYEFR
jgi:outer membrane protein